MIFAIQIQIQFKSNTYFYYLILPMDYNENIFIREVSCEVAVKLIGFHPASKKGYPTFMNVSFI